MNMKRFFAYCVCLIGFLRFIEVGMETSPTGEITKNEYGLTEMTIGKPSAPKTIIVYYSLACFFSRKFLSDTYPEIKRKYIDKGLLKMTFREFYIPAGSEWIIKLSRIAGPKEYFAFMDYAMKNKTFENSKKPSFTITDLVMPFFSKLGYSKNDIDKCLADNSVMEKVRKAAEGDAKKYGLQGAPSFVADGKLHTGIIGIEVIDKFMQTGVLE